MNVHDISAVGLATIQQAYAHNTEQWFRIRDHENPNAVAYVTPSVTVVCVEQVVHDFDGSG